MAEPHYHELFELAARLARMNTSLGVEERRTVTLDDLITQAEEALKALNQRAFGDPESFCRYCGGPNISWSAPSPLWNEVMRGGSINGMERLDGIVCPTCFCLMAEVAGVAVGWRVDTRKVLVPLETTTPSGRVWNEQTWLWDDPVT
jgi:hypothetical protein